MKSLEYLRRQSFRNKLKVAFLAVIVLSVLMTGGLSYYISAATLEKNALKLTQDTVVRSAQIVDEKLNKLMLIMMTFMISQPFYDMLKDAASGDASRYYTHLNDLDNVFAGADCRAAYPIDLRIYADRRILSFVHEPQSAHRIRGYRPVCAHRTGEKNLWVEGHEDMLFSGKERVISLILEPIFDTPVSGVYIVVNIREDGFRKLVQETPRKERPASC